MTKKEYLEALRTELQALPYDEQKEALEYYQNYFDDAGAENEQSVMNEFGSVETLGAYIRSKFSCVPEKTANNEKNNQGDTKNSDKEWNFEKKPVRSSTNNKSNAWLIVLIVILSFPLWIGPVLAVLGTLFGLIVSALAIGCAGIIVAIALFLAGVFVFAFGIAFVSTPFGILLGLGVCLLLSGIALLAGIFGVWLCAKVVPVVIRGIVALCRLPFKKATAN